MAKSSPTKKSLDHLRSHGYTVAIVEHWNPFAKVRQDLFGFLDLVCLHPDIQGVLGIQATSKSNMSARRAKIKAEPRAALWLACGNRIQLFGWDGDILKQEEITRVQTTDQGPVVRVPNSRVCAPRAKSGPRGSDKLGRAAVATGK